MKTEKQVRTYKIELNTYLDSHHTRHGEIITVHMEDYLKLQAQCEMLVEALENIKEWWDVSDPSCVVPKKQEVAGPYYIRNDSMAAMSIIRSIEALERLRKWSEGNEKE